MREINVYRAGDPVHAGVKALTRETPAKRGRVNRYVMYKMGRNFLGDIIWQDTSLCKQFIDLQLVKSFQICNLIFSLKLTLLILFNCLKTPRVCYIDTIFIYSQFTVMMAFLF